MCVVRFKKMKNFIKKIYFNRKKESNKGDFGRVLIIGGSKQYSGAPILASDFAILSGAGYVGLSLPDSVFNNSLSLINKQCIHEIFSSENNDSFNRIDVSQLNKYNSILFGNGVNVDQINLDALSTIINNYKFNLTIDASGIILLTKNLKLLNNSNRKTKNILLTPHIKEACKLFNVDYISNKPDDYLDLAVDFARKYRVNILLKSYYSIFITSEGKYYKSNYQGVPILAHASSGDMLAGYISGILSYDVIEYADKVFYADEIFHQAALNLSKDYGDGILLEDELKSYLLKLIRSMKNNE